MVELTVPGDLLAQVTAAVAAHQPELDVTTAKGMIALNGVFVVSGPAGPFDSYQVRVDIPAGFPSEEALVFETGGRIPKTADRHVSPTGDCCLGVWEEWLVTAPDHKFETFLTGIMHDFFVGQTCFEVKGEWPFGERVHGQAGVLESFSDVLGVANDTTIIVQHLKLLSMAKIKGHNPCPCGSGRRLRQCHRDKLEELTKRIGPAIARRMLNRITLNK